MIIIFNTLPELWKSLPGTDKYPQRCKILSWHDTITNYPRLLAANNPVNWVNKRKKQHYFFEYVYTALGKELSSVGRQMYTSCAWAKNSSVATITKWQLGHLKTWPGGWAGLHLAARLRCHYGHPTIFSTLVILERACLSTDSGKHFSRCCVEIPFTVEHVMS